MWTALQAFDSLLAFQRYNMTATHRNEQEQSIKQRRHWQARIAVRIPRETNEGLLENAKRRLERPADMKAVTVERLCGLDPALAATVADVELRLKTRGVQSKQEVTQLLTTAPGTERIERVSHSNEPI